MVNQQSVDLLGADGVTMGSAFPPMTFAPEGLPQGRTVDLSGAGSAFAPRHTAAAPSAASSGYSASRRDGSFASNSRALSGPISRDIAILSLRYPISRDTF